MVSCFKNVLVLAPHTDDGELGCRGTISRLIENGSNIYYLAFSTAEESVPKNMPKDVLKTEVRKATKELGISEDKLIIYNFTVRKLNYVRQEILEILINLRKQYIFDLILMPCLHDIHQDHITVAEEGLRAFKNTSILGYELIWNNLSFNTTAFVSLKRCHVLNKFRALQMYTSQANRNYMSEDFIFSLAKTRGVQINVEFAESFEVIRWIM